MLKIGVLGAGHLGKIHINCIQQISDYELIGFYDSDKTVSQEVAKSHGIKSFDSIEEFSELGDFIDEPVRTYSSGMRARLAFAVATAVKPDVLILDEVLSTGDESFRKKAESRMKIMQDNAKTVIMISHSAAQLRKLCNRILWLDRGQLLMDGSTKQVLDEYQRFCQNPELWYEKNNHTAC